MMGNSNKHAFSNKHECIIVLEINLKKYKQETKMVIKCPQFSVKFREYPKVFKHTSVNIKLM